MAGKHGLGGTVALALAFASVPGCGPGLSIEDGTADTGTTNPSGPVTELGPGSSTGPVTTVTTAPPTTGTEQTGTGSSGPATSSASSSSTGAECGSAVPCVDDYYECGDAQDNDGDGLFDLDDPDCISPCDDYEDRYTQGLLSGEIDCNLDCNWDGNTGQGDDRCIASLRCDPEDPASWCPAMPESPICTNAPDEQYPECLEFCEPLTPPGCDCFGCCTVNTDEGPIDILLFYAPEECNAATPENCPRCTSLMEQCGNPCDGCEICFGETEPPAGCDAPTCDTGPICEEHCDCPDGGYCFLGCCHPPPPS